MFNWNLHKMSEISYCFQVSNANLMHKLLGKEVNVAKCTQGNGDRTFFDGRHGGAFRKDL